MKNLAVESFDFVSMLLKKEFIPSDFKESLEGQKYGACSFKINKTRVISRVAKVTPTKMGLFVAVWKRNTFKKTVPYNVTDPLDLLIIHVNKHRKRGLFVFSKDVLERYGVISSKDSKGKNGIRVYPPWDKELNALANKTQKWQLEYFLEVEEGNCFNNEFARKLFF